MPGCRFSAWIRLAALLACAARANGCAAADAVKPEGGGPLKLIRSLRARNAQLEKDLVDAYRRLFAGLQGEAKEVELINGLASPYAGVRAAAAEEIGASGVKKATSALRQRLADDSPAVRAAAARALGLLGDAASAAKLIELLNDADPAVQAAAAKSLGELKAASAALALCRGADSPHAEAAQACIEALGEIGDPRAAPRLLAKLRSKSSAVREAAARALGRLAAAARGDVKRRTVAALIAALKDDKERVRWYAVHSLAEAGSPAAEPALIERLSDSSPRVREEAASALGELGSQAAQPGLLRLLADADERVAKQAADSLTRIAAAHPEAAGRIAEEFFRHKDYARAAALWQKQLETASDRAAARRLRLLLADAYAAQQDWPQVIVHLSAAVKIKNGDPRLVARLAQAHFKMHAAEQAAEAMAAYMTSAARRSPEDWTLAARIAQALAEKKEAKAALEFISKLRKADPNLGGAAGADLRRLERRLQPRPADRRG